MELTVQDIAKIIILLLSASQYKKLRVSIVYSQTYAYCTNSEDPSSYFDSPLYPPVRFHIAAYYYNYSQCRLYPHSQNKTQNKIIHFNSYRVILYVVYGFYLDNFKVKSIFLSFSNFGLFSHNLRGCSHLPVINLYCTQVLPACLCSKSILGL